MINTLAVATIAILLPFVHPQSPSASEGTATDCAAVGGYLTGQADKDTITINAMNQQCWEQPGENGGPPVIIEFVRIPLALCGERDVTGLIRTCLPDVDPRTCPDGAAPLGRGFARTIAPTVSEWREVDKGGCPLPGNLETLITEAFTTSILPPTAADRQPLGEFGLVNMPLNLYADPAPHVIDVTLAGWPITITAAPTVYTWDLGDTVDPIATTDPGARAPNHSVAPILTALGTYPITLTTTWAATYQVNHTGPQHPVTGTATTTTTVAPITILEARSRLVADTL